MRFFIGQASDLDLIPTRGEPFSIREEDILVVEANVTSGKLQIFEGHSPLVAVIRDDVVAFQDFGGRKSYFFVFEGYLTVSGKQRASSEDSSSTSIDIFCIGYVRLYKDTLALLLETLARLNEINEPSLRDLTASGRKLKNVLEEFERQGIVLPERTLS